MQWLTRGKKVQSRREIEIWIPFPHFREEKEKFENNFSNFERRKRKLNSLSPVSRGEREIWKQFLLFREEREKVKFPFPSFEKRKRNQTNILDFREEKEKSEIVCSSALTPLYMYFSLLLKAAKCRKNYVSSEMTMTQTLLMWLWPVRNPHWGWSMVIS